MKFNSYTEKSIAVLPFVNMSAENDKEYFSDGITEEIINALAQIEDLKVTSRTSSFYFKGKNIHLKEIVRQLEVAIILEGSVRFAGEKVRIKAQLIDAEEDFCFWSETWDRKLENIFEIQDEVSLLIADKLREHLGHLEYKEHLVEKQTDNLDAYEWYLKALFHYNKWNPEDAILSINYFEKAISLDPNHVESLAGLADAYSFMGTTESYPREEAYAKTIEYTMRANAINPNNANIHYQLANLSLFTDCDYVEAMNHIDHSLKLKPNHTLSLQFKSFLHMLKGELDVAYRYLEIALGIDPLNHETLFYKAYYLYRSKDYLSTEKVIDEILKHNSKNIPGIVVKAYCLLKLHKYDEAIDFIGKSLSQDLLPDEKLGIECLAYILKGDLKKGMQLLEQLKLEAENPYSFQAHSYLYLALVSLGEFDEAFKWLDKALEMKSSVLFLSFSDPLSEIINEDERYSSYAKRFYPTLNKSKTKPIKTPLLNEKDVEKYSAKLSKYIETDKPYLNPGLSLRTLSDLIEIHPNKLSWLLNEKFGKKFNEFINQFRIAHFKALATNLENRHISIIGLAYESGFNSKTVFNTFFKKTEGITPNDFLKSQNPRK